jgi:hypothetical protein
MERKMQPGEDKTRTPYNDPTYNPNIEGANPESVDADMPEQGEPEERDRSRMAEPTPRERVIPRDSNKRRTRRGGAMNPPLPSQDLEREAEHDEP